MKLRNKKTYYTKPNNTTTDAEGGKYAFYGEPVEIQANIYPASGKAQAEIYGVKLNYILNMLYDGDTKIKELDGICVNVDSSSEPDYKVVSIKKYSNYQLMELEKI